MSSLSQSLMEKQQLSDEKWLKYSYIRGQTQNQQGKNIESLLTCQLIEKKISNIDSFHIQKLYFLFLKNLLDSNS